MYAFESPFLPGASSMPTLVARITFFRLALRLNQLPSTVSDSPPLWPGTQREYTSAVSTKLNPASTKASRMAKDVGSSAVQPKTLPPRQMGETSRPDPPKLRVFIDIAGSRLLRRVISKRIFRPDSGCSLRRRIHTARLDPNPDGRPW